MSFDEDFRKIKSNYFNLLENGGIIKLKVEQEKINNMISIANYFDDLECFEILNDNESYLILRHRNIHNKINYREIMDKTDKDFFSKKYIKCLKDYLFLLDNSIYPKPELYAKIGLSYYKLNELNKARDYLMIANYKDNGNENFDLENSVTYFEERVNKIEREKYNTKRLEDNSDDLNKIKIDNIDEIMDYISMHKKDIETVGMEFNLSNEERDYIKLVLAEEFYKQGDMEKGNYYLYAVENSPNKSKKIIKFCEKVRKNKNFYQYREDNKPKKLTFIRTGKRYC